MLLTVLLIALLAACDPTPATNIKDGNTIYFVSNGGSRVESITARAGAPITPPADPTREGYYFVGWFLSRQAADSLSTKPETLPTVMPAKSVTYYAGWTADGAQVILDPKGGELQTTRFSAAIGARLLDLLRAYIPTVEQGVEFLGWAKDGELIDDSVTLGIEGASLEARYAAYFTVNVIKEGLDGSDLLDEEESINEKVPVGTVRTYVYKTYDGYSRASDLQHTSCTLTVGMHPADNVVTVRYNRLRVTVNYLKGDPSAQGEEQSFSIRFGEALTLIHNPFTYDDKHRFAGWRVGSEIFEEGRALEEKDLKVTDGERIDITAVWDEKFEDIGGGVDIVWLLGSTGRDVQLLRENLPVMSGTTSASGTFTVKSATGAELRGKLLRDDGVFTWDLGFGAHVDRYIVNADGVGAGDKNDYAVLNDPQSAELHIAGEVLKGRYHFSNADGAYLFQTFDEQPRLVWFSMITVGGRQYFVVRENLRQTYDHILDGTQYEIELLANGVADLYRCEGEPSWLFRRLVAVGSWTSSGGGYRLSISGTEFDGKLFKPQPYGRTLTEYKSRYAGTFAVDGGGQLVLDGFSGASYTDGDGVTEDGEFYVVDGDAVFFDRERSQHFSLDGQTATIKGSPEVYSAYMGKDETESIVVNGHGKLRYVDKHGRVYYADYTHSAFDGDAQVLKFALDSGKFNYLVKDGVATLTGDEVGVYVGGGAKLYIDGMGGAIYEQGAQRQTCTYQKRNEAPYDYVLSGAVGFRFMLDLEGGTFKRHDDENSGTFTDKFDATVTLFLDGYGAAELREGDEVKVYSVVSASGADLILQSSDYGDANIRILEGSAFVRYSLDRVKHINRYDPSVFDEEGNNLEEDVFLTMDGFDGVTLTASDGVKTGVLNTDDGTGEYLATLDGEEFRFKVFAYPLASTDSKYAFAQYSERNDLTFTRPAGEAGDEGEFAEDSLRLDGFGTLTYAVWGGDPKVGFYSYWDNIIVAKGGDFDKLYFFTTSASSFELCVEVVVDGGVLKRYIGEGGDVTLGAEVKMIAQGAFKNSAVRSVSAQLLESGIAEGAFENCVLLEEFSATRVASIADRAFYGCERLRSISGTGSVSDIGEQAFFGCAALEQFDAKAVRNIRREAFAGTSVRAEFGGSTSNMQIEDRAFAHGDGAAPTIFLSETATELPKLNGDPFAFDGEGEDKFMILVKTEAQLRSIYNSSEWTVHSGRVAFDGAEGIGEYIDVTTLSKVVFGGITTFDGYQWCYMPATTGDKLIRYDSSRVDKTLVLDLIFGDGVLHANTAERGLAYSFVKEGKQLVYNYDNAVTLSFTATAGDGPISATFVYADAPRGARVSLSREDMSFTIGRYTYHVILKVNMTFTYTTTYHSNEVGTYSHATDPSSVITLLQTDEEGTVYDIRGNYLLVTLDQADQRIDLDSAHVQFMSNDGASVRFYVFFDDSDASKCYTVQISFDNDASTYAATVTKRYEGTTYYTSTNNNSLFNGVIISYTEVGLKIAALVMITVTVDDQQYVVTAALDNNTVTIEGDYPASLLGTFYISFMDGRQARITRAS